MKAVILILLMLSTLPAFACYGYQNKNAGKDPDSAAINGTTLADTTALHRHTVLWFTPNKHSTEIDGLALGFWAAPEKNALIIKGVNVEVNPIAMFFWAYSMVGFFTGPFSNDSTTDMPELTGCQFPSFDTSTRAKVMGLSLSMAQFGSVMKGVGVNLVSSWANEMDGLEICGFMNMHYQVRGVSLAIRNKTTHCNGVQIGIFNECRDGSFVQIGLLNRIGNRRMPFVNFHFKRKNKVA